MTIEGLDALKDKLTRLQNIDFSEPAKKAAVDIYNMGQTRTPKKTGELRTSMGVNQTGDATFEVGYAKEYAPHVEYGHRIVRNGRQVGYVNGQRFLQAMVEDEQPVFTKYVMEKIEKC